MAYNKQTWLDGKSGGTPISAARLNYLEQGLADARTVETFTTTQRNALTTGQKWEGRVIYNSTTDRLQQWDGAAWFTVPIDTDIPPLDTVGTPAALGTAARGTSGSAARADHVHPSGDIGATGVTNGTNVNAAGCKTYVRRKQGYLNINLTATGTVAGGSTLATIAAGHRPAEDWFAEVAVAGTGTSEDHRRLHILAAGGIQIQTGGLTNGQILRGSCSYPIP